jgi:hypothetical protein
MMATSGRQFGGSKGMNSPVPSMSDDVMEASRRDIGKAGRGMFSEASGATRAAQQQAGGKALMRLAGRAGAAGAALQGGYDLGSLIEEKTGIGKKMIDKARTAIDEARGRGGVKLSAESERRLADERIKKVGESKVEDTVKSEASAKKTATAAPAKKAAPRAETAPTSSVREGRNEGIDEGVRARAMRAVESEDEGMRRGGKVKKMASGGSVSTPRGVGIAKRGFGRAMR